MIGQGMQNFCIILSTDLPEMELKYVSHSDCSDLHYALIQFLNHFPPFRRKSLDGFISWPLHQSSLKSLCFCVFVGLYVYSPLSLCFQDQP